VARPSLTAIAYDKKGRVLSIGRNSYVKTHPLQASIAHQLGEDAKIYLHAEVACLVKVKDWSKIHRVVVTRFDASGKPVLARPCRICARALALAGVDNIEHT
jgi:tRNA(Arg) A34 adenosine deaminase TadA